MVQKIYLGERVVKNISRMDSIGVNCIRREYIGMVRNFVGKAEMILIPSCVNPSFVNYSVYINSSSSSVELQLQSKSNNLIINLIRVLQPPFHYSFCIYFLFLITSALINLIFVL